MRRKYIRPVSRAALWSPRLGIMALALLFAVFILHRFGFIGTSALFYLAAGIALLACAALISAVCGLRSLWRQGSRGGLAALAGGLLAFIAAAPLIFIGAAWLIFPKINDISTDFENPPVFLAGTRPADALPLKTGFSAAQIQAQMQNWPQLSGRRYDGAPDAILAAVYAVLKAENWPISGQKDQAGGESAILVQAAAKTVIMGFVSDIIIRIADEGDTSFVDIRAASRYLTRDFGINARLAEDFLKRLDAQILSLSADDSGD